MSLLRNLVGVIVLLATGILITTTFAARTAVTELSRSIINVSIELTEHRLREFFEPVTQELLVARQWGESGVLDRRDPAELRRVLTPVLEQYPQAAGIIIADELGRETMLMRTPNGFAMREVNVQEWGTRTHWFEWSSESPEPVESWRDIEYDPRTRPWFHGAMDRREEALAQSPHPAPRELVHWTAPYTFFTAQRPGMTTATAYVAADGTNTVVAIDIELSSISQFTESLRVTEHGGVIVLTQDRRVVGLPPEEQYRDDTVRQAALLRHPEELGLQLVLDAAPAFRANVDRPDQPPVRFESGGETWWGKGKPFVLGPDQLLRVGVVVPERDMITNLWTLRLWIIGITTVVLVTAILRAFILARRFSAPIEQLVLQSEQISQGDLEDHEPIESHVAEFTALAEAQNHMRTALRSLFKLERDMQLARQIQQQTFPAKLPKVDGYKIGAVAKPADETGGDTYDVIGFTLVPDAERGEISDPVRLLNENPRFTALLLADATGHGIGPALAVLQYRAMVRMAIRNGRHLREMARLINDQLCADLPPGRFITAWIAVLDRELNILHSFSAGHAPLIHYVAANNACILLDADTMPFGITRSLSIEVPLRIEMAKGDFFIVVSDGILEMKNTGNEQYGKQRMMDLITRERQSTPQQLIDALRKELNAFSRDMPPEDDCTAVILKRT